MNLLLSLIILLTGPSFAQGPVQLSQGGGTEISYGEGMDTGGLATCLGIILYDPQSKISIGFHEDTAFIELTQELIDIGKQHFSKLENIEVYVSGLAPLGIDPYLEQEYGPQDRAQELQGLYHTRNEVEALLGQNFPSSQIYIRWNTTDEFASAIVVDPELTEVRLELTSYDLHSDDFLDLQMNFKEVVTDKRKNICLKSLGLF